LTIYFDFVLDNRLSTLAPKRTVTLLQHLVEKIADKCRFCLTKWGRGRGQTNPLILKEKPPDRGLAKCLILLGKRGD